MSLGGTIAQLAALNCPARVASLAAIGSSPFGKDNPNLPGAGLAYLQHSAQFAELLWTESRPNDQVLGRGFTPALGVRRIRSTRRVRRALQSATMIERATSGALRTTDAGRRRDAAGQAGRDPPCFRFLPSQPPNLELVKLKTKADARTTGVAVIPVRVAPVPINSDDTSNNCAGDGAHNISRVCNNHDGVPSPVSSFYCAIPLRPGTEEPPDRRR
jgi:hypothetical protein